MCSFYLSVIRSTNLIDLIPACAGMTRVWSYLLLVSPFAKASGDKSPPPVALRATPPARIPPTQTMFARGPGAVGIHTTDAMNYCDSFYSLAVGIKPPRHAYHPRKLHFRGARYRATPPLDEELVTFPLRAEFPSVGGVAACRRGG